jgi:GT2 family glycosyltransferase
LKICEGKNIGFSRGCNLLASYTQAKILLFLNPDTLLVSFNVESIIKFYNDKVIIGPLQVNSIDELNDLDEAQLNRRYLSNDFFYYPVNLSNPKSQTYIDGAALIIPRDYFNELGGFDENIFIFQDDMDLCLRCLNSGGVLVNITDSVVYHYSGGTVKGGYRKDGSDRHETSRLRRHHAEKNQIYLAHKYLPRFTFCTWLLLWCALNIVGSSILFISNEKWLAGSPWISLYDFTRDLLRGKYKQNSCHLNWYVKRKFQFLPGKVSVFLDLGVPTSKS